MPVPGIFRVFFLLNMTRLHFAQSILLWNSIYPHLPTLNPSLLKKNQEIILVVFRKMG